jgi:hypothetical protein
MARMTTLIEGEAAPGRGKEKRRCQLDCANFVVLKNKESPYGRFS